ncbi:MAG: hypothetical protein HY514_01640 [Candidatus Aenigmarchaeota archaeon]|nr:hypothetical protein [Candidatus Aenigmarchaeota archaeon]
MTKITDQLLQEIKQFYIEGKSTTEIKNKLYDKYRLHVCPETIRKRLIKITKIRSRQDAIKLSKRKHLPKDKIIELYTNQKISRTRIAKTFSSSKETIGKILCENCIELRNLHESIQLTNSKYPKISFDEREEEKAYLIGLVEGDLTAFRKSQYTIRVITNTTHYTLVELVKKCFQKYGHVKTFPHKNKSFSNYEWCVMADLDDTFNFLLPENRPKEVDKIINTKSFFSFPAGFVDADGSVIIRKSGKYFQFIIRLFGEDFDILSKIKLGLEKHGYVTCFYRNFAKGTKKTWIYAKDYFVLEVFQKHQAIQLLDILPLQHSEKVSRKEMIQMLSAGNQCLWKNIQKPLQRLKNQISEDTKQSISDAERVYLAAH